MPSTSRITRLLLSLLLFLPLTAPAQKLNDYAERLEKFGKGVPQEEVFLHMDNTSYFLGDTLFFKAYLRRSDGMPSKLSGLLYVELLNQDGYLVELQKIKMDEGYGHGSFALADTLYGGYYELRAYTRWQLNWGQYEHPHTTKVNHWFYNKKMEYEYYRDYDKLYSRVFPVYDKPKREGEFEHNMTTRPMRRYYKADNERELSLSFYPEGGNLIAGKPCRMAFQADDDQGKHQEGKLVVKDNDGNVVAEAQTTNRGRGVFTFTPQPTQKYTAEFAAEKLSGKAKLPQAEADGVAMQIDQAEGNLNISLSPAGSAAAEKLGLTIMSHGLLKAFLEPKKDNAGNCQVAYPTSELETGVIQVTVFNEEGRVYADRLVFVRQPGFQPQNVTVSGISSQAYPAFGPISMTLHGQPNSSLSVAVRDASHSEYIYDDANILTEMLLCSQIKGFVENPNYFFEADDEEHRQALDLLLMVQGWRRYSWKTMAVPDQFKLAHMPERTETLLGEVNVYQSIERENLFVQKMRDDLTALGLTAEGIAAQAAAGVETSLIAQMEQQSDQQGESSTTQSLEPSTSPGFLPETPSSMSYSNFLENEGELKREVIVHAEFAQPGVNGQKGDSAEGDVTTYKKGQFKIQAPGFEEGLYFFLAASDSTKWGKKGKHTWIDTGEEGYDGIIYPEFYVKLSPIRPRFVKPYTYYQMQLAPIPKGSALMVDPLDDARTMKEVTIGARHSGLRGFDASKPAFVVDAYEAFNAVCDAGLCPGFYIGGTRFVYDVAKNYIGDMNMERSYFTDPNTFEIRYNGELIQGKGANSLMSDGIRNLYNNLSNLDEVYVYTDYSPRFEGDKKYEKDQPIVTIDLHRYTDDSKRKTWRDRRYILYGYSVCEDFYHPDYSKRPLPTTKDYRRTLYWNPNVQLNTKGEANIKLYNNSKSTQIIVSAEGMTAKGDLQTLLSSPESR